MPSFSTTLEQSIHAALALANSRSHEFATLEHLLLALVDEPDAARVMKACNVDTEELRTTLVEFIDEDPVVRQTFEAELAKRGMISEMPPEIYTDPDFKPPQVPD